MTGQRSIRVLLIEDNPGDARLVRELLAEEGDRFGIVLAGSLREARDRLTAAPPAAANSTSAAGPGAPANDS